MFVAIFKGPTLFYMTEDDELAYYNVWENITKPCINSGD